MASSHPETTTVNDDSVCSICIETFKTPRYLPCNHSFCTNCLSSYIVNQCKSTEPRLGFRCPLCREYTPSDGDPNKPEGWAERFPFNDILQKIVDQPDEIYCQPCLRENDEEKARDYCLSCKEYLCEQCTKYHRRNMTSLDHTIISTIEMKSVQIVSKEGTNSCPKHRHEKIQMYCHDHEQPCCGLCGCTEHRTCERINTIENAVEFLKEGGEIDLLLSEVSTLKRKLMTAKTKGEMNLSDIENTVDENVAKIEKEFLSKVQYFENLKKEFVDKIFSTLKKGREELQREVAHLEDGIFYTDHLETELKRSNTTTNNTEALMQFIVVKEQLKKAKLQTFRQLHLNISVEKTSDWINLKKLKSIASVQLSVSSSRCFYFDIRTSKLNEPKKHSITGGNLFSGLCLSEGKLLIVNYNEVGICLVCDKNLKIVNWLEHLNQPYSACQCQDEIFVTNRESKTMGVFSSTDFHKIRDISLYDNVYGITSWNGHVYVACTNQILKLDKMGEILRKYAMNERNNLHLVVTKNGIIVYSNSGNEKVTAMTGEGQVVWIYQSVNLKEPLDLDTDFHDNIYIAGRESNNVHVLSNSGELIKMIEDIPNPTSCKIDEEEGIIYVICEGKTVYVYRI